MRFFNTEGPVRPDDHYAIPPLARVSRDEILDLIQTKRYFVLHAPRQTGKTSALIALRDLLNSGEVGNFRCVDVNVEVGQVNGAFGVEEAHRGIVARSERWRSTRHPVPGLPRPSQPVPLQSANRLSYVYPDEV